MKRGSQLADICQLCALPCCHLEQLGKRVEFANVSKLRDVSLNDGFNIISVPIILLGIVLIVIRFAKGIGSITNLTQEVPWGLWIGFDQPRIDAEAGESSLVLPGARYFRKE